MVAKSSRSSITPIKPLKVDQTAEQVFLLPIQLLDVALVCLFLALVFLLGIFPLQDTDFWWHLRTGDIIRQTGRVPHNDPYLFGGRADKPWVDLHWLFQVLLSFGYQHGGVDLLTLAKCGITTVGLALLLLARQRGWPVWVMVAAWLPALFLLAGRMYVRPETLTLLYMTIILFVMFHWREHARLAWLLPLVMLLWVNSQGLFILGLFLIGLGLFDAACAPGALHPENRRWWRITLPACVAACLATLLNPYGLVGALFPFRLATTMTKPVFESIAELTPLHKFVEERGWNSVPLGIHIGTVVLGVLSFLFPMAWCVWTRNRARMSVMDASAALPKRKRRRSAVSDKLHDIPDWRLRPFRLFAFVAFSLLSLKATRNSQQFAIVAGTITAWNFGEWAAAIKRRRAGEQSNRAPRHGSIDVRIGMRLVTFTCLCLVFLFVAAGGYYQWQGEGRQLGLGEKPLWFPHQAVNSAHRPGMPRRFVCFHLGHAAVWEYHLGPERPVYCDARLEVIGPDLYVEYLDLQHAIRQDRGWEPWFQAREYPGILADLVQSHPEFRALVVTLLNNRNWECVWFDPVAALFVHKSHAAATEPVDFWARHFAPDPANDPADAPSLIALATTLSDLAAGLAERERSAGKRRDDSELAHRLLLLGHGYARRASLLSPDAFEPWKLLGKLELSRFSEPSLARRKQGIASFDPIVDLPLVRATYAMRNALGRRHDDFTSLYLLSMLYQARGMSEAERPLLESLLNIGAINPKQREMQGMARSRIEELTKRMGPQAVLHWNNLDELNREVDSLIGRGRTESAARLLEEAYPPQARTWEQSDRIATMWLHLGEPSHARRVWEEQIDVPRPGLQHARIALTYLVEGADQLARAAYHEALSEEPELFEALYCLAVMEADAGNHSPAESAATKAIKHAPGPDARRTIEVLLNAIRRPGSDRTEIPNPLR